MKKVISLLLVVLICFCLTAGCTKSPVTEPETTTDNTESETTTENTGTSKAEEDNSPLAQLRKRIADDGCEVGVAFVGYVDSKDSDDELITYLKSSAVASKYPFLAECSPIEYEGSELYAFVPASENDSITVYRSEPAEKLDNENHRELVIYKGDKGETVVLRCNLSELRSNVMVEVNELEFHPYISLMDGKLAAEKGCFDFSV